MRTDSTVNKKSALIIYLGGLSLTYSQQLINQSLQKQPELGLPNTSGCIREFLVPNAPDSAVIKEGSPHCTRKRATVFFYSAMSDELKGAFFPCKDGKHGNFNTACQFLHCFVFL